MNNYFLLESRSKDEDKTNFEDVKAGIVAYLKVAPGGKMLMAGSAEQDEQQHAQAGGGGAWWPEGAPEGAWWPETGEQGEFAGDAGALNKGGGKGKGQFQ